MSDVKTVSDIGELGLLKRLFRFCPADVIGDDAAVIDLPPGRKLVVTTDVLVDGVHFSDRTTSCEDIGWRAIAANLSDLAAMGASPEGVTVGLSLPGSTAVEWLDGVYRGMAACLKPWEVDIIGGDLCRSETVSLAVTALGSVHPERVLYRRGAEPGQVILATGYHGMSRAGLELLLHPEYRAGIDPAVQDRWVAAHQRPRPRLDVVDVLNRLWSATAENETVAAMDTSDGLANAVQLICRASGVGARLWKTHLPIDPALVDWVGEDQAIYSCLYGGEDFELLLCLSKGLATSLQQAMGSGSMVIGEITTVPTVELWPEPDSPIGLEELNLDQGFQHF